MRRAPGAGKGRPVITERDEFLHPEAATIPGALFGDTAWLSVMDAKANVFGVAQIFFSNHGYARWASLFQIDGVPQYWGNKHAFSGDHVKGPWTDGRMRYEIVRPLEEIRVALDGPLYAYDLTFTARFPAFEYDHSAGDASLTEPSEYFSMVWGGHFEQAMHCHGRFEIRAGPNRGETRVIDCPSHRERSWLHNFHEETEWERSREDTFPGHYWLILHLPDAQICALGSPKGSRLGMATVGILSNEVGSHALRGVEAEVLLDASGQTAEGLRFRIDLPDGRTLRARTTKKHGEVKLWYRGDNCLDNPVDCYEGFFDFELDDGRRAQGVCEYSIHPARRRWLA